MRLSASILLLTALLLTAEITSTFAAPPRVSVPGDWKILAIDGDLRSRLDVEPAETETVTDEQVVLPLYNDKGPAYRRGYTLKGVKAAECSVSGALILDSVVVSSEKGNTEKDSKGKQFTVNTDYKVDGWGGIGRLEGGAIEEKQPVYITYRFSKMRVDSVVNNKGKLEIRKGESNVSVPVPPVLKDGEKRLANIWLRGDIKFLSDDDVFPILSEGYKREKQTPSVAEKLLPKTLEKLKEGKLTILAWGDSVTDAGYLPKEDRWQSQFVERLKKAYPKAEITMLTEAWGGRNTASYLGEPAGSVHNYQEKVLDVKPDLIIMEFVNDAGLNEQQLFQRYGKLLADFKKIGAEWIILTPHYVRPDWMGLTSCKNCDDDPRPYVKAVRKFGTEAEVAVAEGAKRYGHLWQMGIPYLTLMTNNINHPDKFGMSLFADALMELFPVDEKK
jgi:lysophospholipase L1-like esterase